MYYAFDFQETELTCHFATDYFAITIVVVVWHIMVFERKKNDVCTKSKFGSRWDQNYLSTFRSRKQKRKQNVIHPSLPGVLDTVRIQHSTTLSCTFFSAAHFIFLSLLSCVCVCVLMGFVNEITCALCVNVHAMGVKIRNFILLLVSLMLKCYIYSYSSNVHLSTFKFN